MLKEILRCTTHHAALTPIESTRSSSLHPQSRRFMVWKNCTLAVLVLVVAGCTVAWAQRDDEPAPSSPDPTTHTFQRE
jgi:hypothetical protein